jgi:hypothetical protein
MLSCFELILIMHGMEGTGGMELDPQLILEDEAYDEAALSSAIRVSASESRGTMWHMVFW